MFKPSKKIAAVLALGMISSLFVGTGTASAANGVAVSVDRVKTFADDAHQQDLGYLQIKEDADYPDAFKENDSFMITLPSSLKWIRGNKKGDATEGKYVTATPTPTSGEYVTPAYAKGKQGTVDFTDSGTAATDKVEITISGDYTMNVTLTGNSWNNTTTDTIKIPLYANFDGVAEGYAYATIEGMESPVPSGDYAIAQVMSGGTTASCTDTFTAGQDTTAKFTFRLTETTIGTFDKAAKNGEDVKFTLPRDIDFKSVTVTGLAGADGTVDSANFDKTIANATYPFTFDENKLTVNMKALADTDNKDKTTPVAKNAFITFPAAGDTARGILEFVVNVNVDDDAVLGQADLDIEGEDEIDDATIKVGTVVEYGAALSVDDPTTVLAGSVCQELGTIVIYENAKESATANRSIKVKLPDGVQFSDDSEKDLVAAVNVKNTKGSLMESYSWDEDTLTIKTQNSSARAKIEIDMKKLNIAADFVGDIVATIEGRAGIEGEVVIGTAIAPAEIKMDTVPDVKIGYQDQAVSDITITEAEAGAFKKDGYVWMFLPDGVTFNDDSVNVEVTDGNLEISSVDVNSPVEGLGYVKFKIKSESTANKPGTVTISGLALTVNRTVAEGPIKATIKGDAIVLSAEANMEEPTVAEEYGTALDEDEDDDFFFDKDEVCRVVIANCVTPGAGEVVNSAVTATSTFVIGSTASVIAGEESTMPIAPYISNSRTLCPVRYVAYACGIPEANVVWNPDLQTVTLMNNNGTIVQLTIGSTTMLINGVPVVMDVAPEITGGYTFLPARYVANAFGYDAAWDAATQTVTLTPIAK